MKKQPLKSPVEEAHAEYERKKYPHEIGFTTKTGKKGRVIYRRIPVRGGFDIEAKIQSIPQEVGDEEVKAED